MAPRGQAATMPGPDWHADPDRHSPGLVVRPVGEDGTSVGVYDFATFPLGPQLQEAFATAFDRHCG